MFLKELFLLSLLKDRLKRRKGKVGAWLQGTHWSGLEMLVREAPLVPVELIVHQVLLHDLVILVKEQIADRTGGCILQVTHWIQERRR